MSAPLEPGSTTVGNVPISRMRAAINELRAACRAEGTDRIQAAIDNVEEWIDPIFCTEAPGATALDAVQAREDRLREALRDLEKAAAAVTPQGPVTGPEWVLLAASRLQAWATLEGST